MRVLFIDGPNEAQVNMPDGYTSWNIIKPSSRQVVPYNPGAEAFDLPPMETTLYRIHEVHMRCND